MKLSVRDMILTALFAGLMVVGAYIKIFLPAIPLSFQAFFCALAGMLLGSRLGALSQVIYLLIGLVGLPVFTQGGGPMYVLKPSFGFLLGFLAAAYVIGKISEKMGTINLKTSLTAVMAGLAVIYIIGLPYMFLALRLYLGKPVTAWYVISQGMLPFIVKDIIMYVLAAIIAVKAVPVIRMSRR